MKTILVGLTFLTSLSAISGEISADRCMLDYSYQKDVIILTNVIDPESEAILEENCFDVAKRAIKATINGKQVSGVEVIYKN